MEGGLLPWRTTVSVKTDRTVEQRAKDGRPLVEGNGDAPAGTKRKKEQDDDPPPDGEKGEGGRREREPRPKKQKTAQ